MKKLSLFFTVVFALSAGPAMAQNYVVNIDGMNTTYYSLPICDQFTAVIGVKDLPEQLLADACVLTWDHTVITITGVEINDDGGGGSIGGSGPVSTWTSTGTGCWNGALSAASWVTLDGDPNTTQLLVATGITGGGSCPASGTRDDFLMITFDTTNGLGLGGPVAITLSDSLSYVTGVSGPLPILNDPHTITVYVQLFCSTDADCNDGLWCTAYQTCDTCTRCVYVGSDPCEDDDECTLNGCTEAATPGETNPGTCDNSCDSAILSGPEDPCCSNPACVDDPICLVNTIPTITEWGIIILSLFLLAVGVIVIFRRSSMA